MTALRTPTRALVREVPDSYPNCLVRDHQPPEIDLDLARRQHATYTRVLAANGLELLRLPADHEYPDSCFIEDTVVVLGDRALITRPGAQSRRGESAPVEAALLKWMPVQRVQPPGTLDGGDVLIAGGHLFVGRSERTNLEGIHQLSSAARENGLAVSVVPVRAALHLKSMVTALTDDLLICAEQVEFDPAGLDLLRIPEQEAFAANVVRLPGSHRLMLAEGATRTAERLQDSGFEFVTVDTSEFRKGDGALTCLSVLF